MIRTLRLVTALAVCTTLVAPVEAQNVTGTVIDDMTQQPLGEATVRLLVGAADAPATAQTDTSGLFSLGLPEASTYTLRVAAPGYETVMFGNLALSAGQFLKIFLQPAAPGAAVGGVVLDDSTGRALPRISVMLLDPEGKVRSRTISDSSGSYSLVVPGPGTYSLRSDAGIHGAIVTPPFRIEEGKNPDVELRVSQREVTQLEQVTVTGESVRIAAGPIAEFYERAERGWGEFITREDIEKKSPFNFTGALRLTGSVRVVRMRSSPGGQPHYTIRFKGVSGRSTGNACAPILYLDGAKLGSIDDAEEGGPDLLINPADLEGIELYRPSAVPPQFSGSDASCGVIVVWTKRTK